ncbi:MAG: 3-hydroxyacyl-ACP dehydratase FabZ [Gammaproteobacteria bacterium]|nr:3-hydroxyacyl-ACP dehydratase FabZ [Gammaproteobacteria bacterium]
MSKQELNTMDIQTILDYLPHRYPFLLIDRVLDYTVGESLQAIKNVTINEPFFQGHFPVMPVMPGVLIVEAMAQAAGILTFLTTETKPGEDNIYYLAGIDKARFKQPVVPGDQLIIDVAVHKSVRNIWKFKAQATVKDKIVCSAEIMCAGKS